MNLVKTITALWAMFFGFFPVWFQVVCGVLLAFMVVIISVKLVKFLKDLLWPF